MVTIINYGMGNLGSVANMFKRIGILTQITNDPVLIANAKKILLPGVGAFDAAMEKLNSLPDLRNVLDVVVLGHKIPVLGICLGMQLLTKSSEEGNASGLGWLDARTVRFSPNDDCKIPHMGWNVVKFKKHSPLVEGMTEEEQRFYFVHTYHVVCNDHNDVLGETSYISNFPSMIQKGNIYGAQFHPEKSHKYGMNLLSNFAKL